MFPGAALQMNHMSPRVDRLPSPHEKAETSRQMNGEVARRYTSNGYITNKSERWEMNV